MQNITLSADSKLIAAARERAQSEKTTLNEQFRHWLAGYAQERGRLQRYDTVMASVRGGVKVGGRLNRDERNER